MSTISSLLARAIVVMNERIKEMNTAGRIGSLFRDILQYLDNFAKKEDVALGLINRGSVPLITNLPNTAQRGDAFYVISEGFIYQYDGNIWNKTIFTNFPSDIILKSDIQQTTGTATDKVMSQDAVTKALASIEIPEDVLRASDLLSGLGDRTDTTMTQKGITESLVSVADTVSGMIDQALIEVDEKLSVLDEKLIVIDQIVETGVPRENLYNTTNTTTITGYYTNSAGNRIASATYNSTTQDIFIPKGATNIVYRGGLSGTNAGIALLNEQKNAVLSFLTSGSATVINTLPIATSDVNRWFRGSFLNTSASPILPFSITFTTMDGEIWHVTRPIDLIEPEITAFNKQFTNANVVWTANMRFDSEGVRIADTRFKSTIVDIEKGGGMAAFIGIMYEQDGAHHVFFDTNMNFLGVVPNSNPEMILKSFNFEVMQIARFIGLSYYKQGDTLGTFSFDYHLSRQERTVFTEQNDFDIFLSFFIKNIKESYNFRGRVNADSATPPINIIDDVYFALVSGTVFGIDNVRSGDLIRWNGSAWEVLTYRLGLGGGGSGGSVIDYDVVIVGGGSGGIASAYALKNSGLKVALVEKYSKIGGTHLNAWINVLATTPPPPFLKSIIESEIINGGARYVNDDYKDFTEAQLATINYDNTYLRKQFTNKTEVNITLDVDKMATRYQNDLNGSIDIYLSHELVNTKVTAGKVTEIGVSDGFGTKTLKAKVFIDSTADNVLLQQAGLTLLQGEESTTNFLSDYGFTEPYASNANHSDRLNSPTMMFRLKEGTEDLSEVGNWTGGLSALFYFDPSRDHVYVNSVATLGNTGISVLQLGRDAVIADMTPKTLQFWKKRKPVAQETGRDASLSLHLKKYLDPAPLLGVRETFRSRCERLLNENHLYVKISSANIKDGDNLDKKIACGNHIVDFHGTTGVNYTAINNNRKPYGVPYGSLIPKGLSNVFVASRGSGLTHVGAASFRLNKDIMQLGWAAGHAARIMISQNLTDTRNVDVDTLQSSQYTDFENTVIKLETLMI